MARTQHTHLFGRIPGDSDGKESACNTEGLGSIPGSGRSPRGGNATHSSILAWRIKWTEEPGGLVHDVAKRQIQLSHNTFTFRRSKVN